MVGPAAAGRGTGLPTRGREQRAQADSSTPWKSPSAAQSRDHRRPARAAGHERPQQFVLKCRRAFVAGYHLARFLQAFPEGSRVSLVGQSYGGRVVPSALHLLAGGELSDGRSPPVRLPDRRPDLRVRAVAVAGAIDRHWLDPGERLGCEAFLNLYDSHDRVLIFYPLLVTGDQHKAIGRAGLRPVDYERLGPLAGRYAERDMYDRIGREHTLLRAVADPEIARAMAPYTWAAGPGNR